MAVMEGIEAVVQHILSAHGEPWPEDITDRVFLTIQGDAEWLTLYKEVVDDLNAQGRRGKQIVNQYIGRRVSQLTTGVNRGRCDSPASTLIQSYERH